MNYQPHKRAQSIGELIDGLNAYLAERDPLIREKIIVDLSIYNGIKKRFLLAYADFMREVAGDDA